MKVYSWIGFYKFPEIGMKQARFVCAAKSKAAAARSVNDEPRRLFNFGETGNDNDCNTALAEPGVAFVRTLDYSAAQPDYLRAVVKDCR